mmetsp:Transcript_6917/g.9588  ORF Transcript_6917/g.9588 Transcript_6917/m.9588 type:complete len:202 (-) Transcript_6917:139-744(-)
MRCVLRVTWKSIKVLILSAKESPSLGSRRRVWGSNPGLLCKASFVKESKIFRTDSCLKRIQAVSKNRIWLVKFTPSSFTSSAFWSIFSGNIYRSSKSKDALTKASLSLSPLSSSTLPSAFPSSAASLWGSVSFFSNPSPLKSSLQSSSFIPSSSTSFALGAFASSLPSSPSSMTLTKPSSSSSSSSSFSPSFSNSPLGSWS